MKTNLFIFLIAVSMAIHISAEAQNEKLITLPDIDISQSENGIVSLPANTPSLFIDIFSKYTKVTAPNGKPIHMLAQSGWTDDQIKKARNVLVHLLTDYPGSKYGEKLDSKTDLSIQDLRANECPAEGSEDYMNHITRDASFEEILHLVQGYGMQYALPRYQSDIRTTNDIAAQQGWI